MHAAQTPSSHIMTSPGKPIHILVVDSEAANREQVIQTLSSLGFTDVESSSDGAYALGMLEISERPFDLVICSLNMPEVDGIEFVRLANDCQYYNAIILTSSEDLRILETATDLARAHHANILGGLQHPLDPTALESLLAKRDHQPEPAPYPPQEAITRRELEEGLKSTGYEEIAPYYQPKVEVSSGRITSVETLARWQHKDRGLLGPGAFIPLAEKQALINPLTFAIYRKAVQQISSWRSEGLSLSASINFSINTFMLDKFPDFLQDIAQEYDVSPENIILEITETQVMKKATSCLEVLMRLRLKKFKLSIDDFGTGTSSMTQLKAIPFNELKIDKAFVKSAQSNSSAMAILETSVDLARKLGMTIVAEGAETREEWDLCKNLGVDYIQGFYCAQAMTNEELIPFVREWNKNADPG